MNRTIITTTIRERFSAPNRWFAAVVIFAVPLLPALMGAPASRNRFLDAILIWLVGSGIIGEEISSGTILLVLSRPVRRWEYVISKWIALSAVTIALLLVQAGLEFLLVVRAGGHPELPAILAATGQAVLRGVGAAAVLLPFSVAIAGGKEISAIMLTYALGTVVELYGKAKMWVWCEYAGQMATRFLLPTVDPAAVGTGFGSVPGQLAIFALTVIGALSAAILLLERRELSYSAG